MEVRLLIYLLPEQEFNQRIRNAQKNARKKGRQIGKDFRARAALNLFITDVDEDTITVDNAWSLYRLRWQIELAFKVWKSIWEIDEIKKVKKARLECYIFSKLLIIILCWSIVWQTAKAVYGVEGKALSIMKAFKTLKRYSAELRHVFTAGDEYLFSYLVEFFEVSRSKHLLEKKRGRESSIELLSKSLLLMDGSDQIAMATPSH